MKDEDFHFFRKLYEEYKTFGSDFLEKNYKYWIGSKKLSKKKLKEIFINFRLETFFTFLGTLRTLYYSKDIFEVIKRNNEDVWYGVEILNFLLDKNLIKIESGKVFFKEDFDHFFIKPMDELEIVEKLRRSLRRKIKLEEPLLLNIDPNSRFKWKARYDQMPITTKSAISILSKISHYFPVRAKFAFVGDDDFISIPFRIIFNAPTFSIDKDRELLSEIERISKKMQLNIFTLEADVRKTKMMKDFYGFYTNPPYNLHGSIKFLKFGSNLLSDEGGVAFLVLGYDAIGKRSIHLQKEMSNMGYSIKEVTPSLISYKFHLHHKEDVMVWKKMKDDEIDIKNREALFAALYVLEYIGKTIDFKPSSDIYCYI